MSSSAPLTAAGIERNCLHKIKQAFRLLAGAAAVAALTPMTHAVAGEPSSRHDKNRPILVYTKAAGFVHKSIPVGAEAIRKLGAANGFDVDVTADPEAFSEANLRKYKAVVFLSTTGNVLPTANERAAMEGFIRRGGGFFGVHAASDMGPVASSWPFYLNLVGAAFKGHTNARLYSDTPMPPRAGVSYGGRLAAAPADAEAISPTVEVSSSEPARIVVEDRSSPAVRGWGPSLTRTDEWYGFVTNPRSRVHVIASVDEATYTPGAGLMNGDHPVVWCHAFDGGRSVYTALGHPISVWNDPAFLRHILGGIQLATGATPFRC